MRTALILFALTLFMSSSRADPAAPCIDTIDGLALPSAFLPAPPDMFERLSCLDTLTDAEVEAMLNSDDPRLIGIGIQAADRRRRIDLLASHPEFAIDTRQTLPVEVMTSNPIPPNAFPMKQTVADFYRGMMDSWFGVWPLTKQEVLDVIPKGADPWDYARPWVVNIHRTALRNDPAQMQAIFNDLRTRPDELRVFVIGWTFSMGAFPAPITVDEARAAIDDITEATVRSMSELVEGLPPDNALKHEDFRRRIVEVAMQIRTASP